MTKIILLLAIISIIVIGCIIAKSRKRRTILPYTSSIEFSFKGIKTLMIVTDVNNHKHTFTLTPGRNSLELDINVGSVALTVTEPKRND